MLLTHVKSIPETCNQAQDFLVFMCRHKLISKYLPKFEIVIFLRGKRLRAGTFTLQSSAQLSDVQTFPGFGNHNDQFKHRFATE